MNFYIIILCIIGILIMHSGIKYVIKYRTEKRLKFQSLQLKSNMKKLYEKYNPEKQKKNMIEYSIIYINLDRSPDRREFMENQFKMFGITNYTRFPAIDGDNLDKSTYKSNYITTKYETACTLSHLYSILEAYKSGEEAVVIFEDDISLLPMVVWKKTLREYISTVPDDWGIIQLTYSNTKYMSTLNTDGFMLHKSKCCGTGSYIINKKGMKDVLRCYNNNIFHITNKYFQSVSGAADYFIYDQTTTYTLNTPLFIPYNSSLESTIHPSHTISHITSSNTILNRHLYSHLIRGPTNLNNGRDYSDCPMYHANAFDLEKQVKHKLLNTNQKIPKIIHQIWIGPNKPPMKWINTIKEEYIKKYPDWKYILWTEDKISKFNIINRSDYENEKTYAGKTDILRLEILYAYGGIYIDADSIWLETKSFDGLLDAKSGFFIAYEEKKKNGIANGVIGASKNNPILSYLIKCMFNLTTICKGVPAYKTTGPYFMDRNLNNFRDIITIYPSFYFYPQHWSHKDYRSIKEIQQKYQNSYLFQFGYSTNNFTDSDFT
jgi:GR25 family glycosyltransferase involved in LPS biosynthesis